METYLKRDGYMGEKIILEPLGDVLSPYILTLLWDFSS
jgi:hypothetical protein